MALDIATLLAQHPENVVHIDLAGDELRQNWRRYMAEWGQRPPFYLVSNGIPNVLVGRYQDFKTGMLAPERFTVQLPRTPGAEMFDYMGGAVHVGQIDGAAHDRVRRLLMPAFAPAKVMALETGIRAFIEEMLDAIEAKGGSFDAMADFSSQLIVRALLDVMLGLHDRQKLAFQQMHEAIGLMQHVKPGEPMPEGFVKAFAATRDAILELLAERRAHPGHDFVSAMVQARDAGDQLSDEELFGNIFAICSAGLGTTATAMGHVLLNLCRHPDQFEQVKRDPSLIAQTVEESLRYTNSGFLTFPRFATEDTTLGGTPIAKGMPVLMATQAASYDPAQYPDPLRFDIHRKPKQLPTFGMGPHTCIGNQVARFILNIGLQRFIARFPDLRLVTADFEPRYQGMLGELNPASIPMRWR